MRLGPVMIVMFVTWIILGLLSHTLDSNLSDFGGSGSTFFNIITQPNVWQTNTFLVILLSSVVAVSGITIGASFLGRSDIIVLAPLAALFFAMGAVTMTDLYLFITRNVGQFACTAGQACMEATVIGSLTAGIFALMYSMTILEWWLWRPVTI